MAKVVKVLLIDDSEIALAVVRDALLDAGLDVKATSTLEDFDDVIGDWIPDLILSDVEMPGMSGPQLCKLLKARYETMHVPVVLLSTLAESELSELALECEADGYLSKLDGVDGLADELLLLYESISW